ncbi:ketoacyl-ACP synthase III family protein [Kutzneria chonburiensis]|uniref:Ketoacyl-ACP synthase III family protein n=1 Tax=Kutzneria chonburiensis TaxID=1483604 RepID=A0ABV6MK97_9PSEU|nr:ketoacyl-ACP synthase III family protein [Kutzneria chonburiensis]
MDNSDLWIAGCASWLPPAVTAEEAAADGRCDRALLKLTGMISVCVTDRDSAPEMAVRAGRSALARSGIGPDDIDLVLHANAFYQGHDLWAPASYVQRNVVGGSCPAMEVRQASNGGMAAIELAGAYLSADSARHSALLTTGDRFCLPGFDRWRSDTGTVYADGGTALVLSRKRGFARVRSLVTRSAPELEQLHRGDDPFARLPHDHRTTVDLDACRRAFLAKNSSSYLVARISAVQEQTVKEALARAGVSMDDIARFVLPHFGLRRLEVGYFRKFDLDPNATTWPWARKVGHLGAGDQFAGFEHLVATGAVRPGDLCCLMSVGAGFSWSAAVVEVVHTPDWSRS